MGLWAVGSADYKGLLFETPLMTALILVFTALLGLCMGSFFNCFAWRIVHGESVMKGRSHCPHCDHPLKALDLIPVLSFLCLKGRCRYCGQKLSARYLGAELITALVFVSIVLFFDISWLTLQYLLLASVLLCISFADLEDYLVPDRFIIAGIVIRLAFVLALSDDIGQGLLDMLIGGLCVTVPLIILVLIADKLLGRDTMGGGDIKLIFMTGLYFHWSNSLLMMIIACVLGILFAIVSGRTGGIAKWEDVSAEELAEAMARSADGEETPAAPEAEEAAAKLAAELEAAREQARVEQKAGKHPVEAIRGREQREAEIMRQNRLIPFGPAIAAGAWVVLLVGDRIVDWYMGLFL